MEKPIEYYCDMDLSNTRNNYTTYETTEKPHFFLVTDYTEKADPKKINSKGVYKKGYDWLNVETHTDSVQRIIQVDETGWLVDRDIVR
jgi:dTDP-D-glucose 4,6-dehydratase